jgi:nucleoside-diphosphate-sugar epimerase
VLNLRGKRCLVTGGASFIGSALVGQLLDRGAEVSVVDDFSSGKFENLARLDRRGVFAGDLLDPRVCDLVTQGQDVVFHLAADHGGRGYVDLHQVACARNLQLDQQVFAACHANGVKKVVFASSGCVYRNDQQTDVNQVLYLTEDMVGPPFDADNMYGWAKLMAEMTLRHYAAETDMKTASARYFTVYGPRGKIDHAIMALLGRAFVRQDPFVIWGDGTQVRNWTFIDDIVEGTIRCAEEIDDGTAVNLGTTERNTVAGAARIACDLAGHDPEFEFQVDMPTGPVNRVADNTLARELLGWEPTVELAKGMELTWQWINDHWDVADVEHELRDRLTER